jgi:hypothetical protein
MADRSAPVPFEDIPLEEARRLGRWRRIAPEPGLRPPGDTAILRQHRGPHGHPERSRRPAVLAFPRRGPHPGQRDGPMHTSCPQAVPDHTAAMGSSARAATGALPHESVDSLDKRPGEDTILSTGRSEGLRLLAGRSGWQQPFAEERCDGYAALLLSASRGLVSRRRVCGYPLRRCLTGRGFFMTYRRLSLDRPYWLCYHICCVFQSPAGQHRREHHGTASAILRPVAVFL